MQVVKKPTIFSTAGVAIVGRVVQGRVCRQYRDGGLTRCESFSFEGHLFRHLLPVKWLLLDTESNP